MTLSARIYPTSRNVMQAGRAKIGHWILEYDPQTQRFPDDVIGWTSSADSLNQVRLKFPSKEAAESFAKTKNLSYTVTGENARIVTPRNYVDNFKYRPVEDNVKDRQKT